MKLQDICALLGVLPFCEDENPTVGAVTHNAAWVQPSGVFVAIAGAVHDGHKFIDQALQNGAVAVIGEGLPEGQTCKVPYLQVKNARQALAVVAAALAGHPSRDLLTVGVTGTDGKTSTAWLTHHLMNAAGLPAGLLSTVGYRMPAGELQQFPAHFSTPEAPQLQELLAAMRDAGARAVMVEASSHALALGRVHGVHWNVAIWTHLSAEHLDFHGSLENYFADKKRLIEAAPFAVLNLDDPWCEGLRGVASAETWYSLSDSRADWHAKNVVQTARGLSFEVHSPLGSWRAELPMIGEFNIANALAAMAAVAQLGATAEDLQRGLASFAGVPGRMEIVPTEADCPRVVVDFAHTPPSLEKVLASLRADTAGKLWVLIGSAGGLRDPGKRGPLGEVATRVADFAVFTEEDHRDTPLVDILQAMEKGAAGRDNFKTIPDRRKALRWIIANVAPEDTVLLAGKGTEDVLERGAGGQNNIPWNERAEALAALSLR